MDRLTRVADARSRGVTLTATLRHRASAAAQPLPLLCAVLLRSRASRYLRVSALATMLLAHVVSFVACDSPFGLRGAPSLRCHRVAALPCSASGPAATSCGGARHNVARPCGKSALESVSLGSSCFTPSPICMVSPTYRYSESRFGTSSASRSSCNGLSHGGRTPRRTGPA